MAKGENIREMIGVPGQVTSMTEPDFGFLYETSTVKHPKYNPGDRVELPDGRVFRYAKSTGSAVIGTNLGCAFTYTGYTAYTAFGVAAAVGGKSITIPAATHATLTEDELRGGYVVIFDGSDSTNNQIRGIIGNDAASSNAAFKVYLDAPLTYAITAATSACETYANPWAALAASSSVAAPKAGIAATKIPASANYFWVQTKGWTFISPQSRVTGKVVGFCWRHDGSLDSAVDGFDAAAAQHANVTTQYGGFRVEGTADGNGPLVFLQGD